MESLIDFPPLSIARSFEVFVHPFPAPPPPKFLKFEMESLDP